MQRQDDYLITRTAMLMFIMQLLSLAGLAFRIAAQSRPIDDLLLRSFLRSEYELRWGSAVSAQNFYEQGIRLSFEERGVAGAEDYIADEANVPEAYTDPLGVIENNTALPQSRITIKWKEDAQFEENLERIITQKWIAIFPLGNEAWAEYRRWRRSSGP